MKMAIDMCLQVATLVDFHHCGVSSSHMTRGYRVALMRGSVEAAVEPRQECTCTQIPVL
jgi:hypothetical protein